MPKAAAIAVAATTLVASGFIAAEAAAPAAADWKPSTPMQATVVGTDNMGVGCRTAPYGPVDCGWGAGEGQTVNLECFYSQGDPVGPNGNTLWYRVEYGGREFFVADHWLDTPDPIDNRPGDWFTGPGCQ